MSKNGSKIGALLVGVGLGATLGVLFAPKSGEETRRDLKKKLDEFVDYLKNLDYNEIKDNLIEKAESLREELEDLDKEKVLEIAKIKAEDIKKKADELYKSAVEQGKPIVENAAKEIKAKTTIVLKNVLDRLENETPKKVETKKPVSYKKPAPKKKA